MSCHFAKVDLNSTVILIQDQRRSYSTLFDCQWNRTFFALLAWVVMSTFASSDIAGDDKNQSQSATVVGREAGEDSTAASPEEMKPYTEALRFSQAKFEMVPIPGGEFTIGSPEDEENRNDDEGPQRKVTLSPFWMGKHEITWDVYEVWMFDLDIAYRTQKKVEADASEKLAEEYQISQPTKPYTDMSFGMGRKNFPAISMTQFAARTFCQWLSRKTGHYYRLPTESEWEYACRAGTTTAYHFGEEIEDLDDYAWHYENSDETYQKVGQKKPNPWGLYDMHGNIAEWVLDQYTPVLYEGFPQDETINPLLVPVKEYPRVVRGGSWDDDPEVLRSAARMYSSEEWKRQDPQFPKSIWYHTDAQHIGFRIVRPFKEPSEEEKEKKWERTLPAFDRHSGR